MHERTQHSGFTLIELLMYIAITLITGVVVIQGIVSFGRVLAQFKLTEDLNYSATIALDALVRDVRNALEVNVPASTFDSSPGELVLTFMASDDSLYERRYSIDGGVLYVEENSGALVALTRTSVSIDSFTLSHAYTTRSEVVRISLTLSASRGSITKQQTLTTAAVVRNLYQ